MRALAALLLLAPVGCAKKAAETSATFPVGLVYDIGGRGDKSFNDAAYAGLDSAQRTLGITFTTLETNEGSDREAQLRQLSTGANRLVFGVGFLFTDDIKNLANEFPDQKFACVDYTWSPGDSVPANLLGLKFREEEGSFLVGALAALTSTTGKVGFVGGMDIPLIRKFHAGYEAGARAVNPNVVVIAKYAGNTGAAFKDPTKGKELALAEYHEGADVIFHASGSTGLGVFEAARELKKLAIGVDADQYDEAPGFILTSMIKRVDHAVYDAIRDAKDGRWQGGVRTMGLKEHGVSWVYDARNQSLIPAHVKATVDSLEQEIVAGRIKVPTETVN